MNLEGLDYNTQREALVLPEYGREVQRMVNHCMTIEDKEERQRYAEAIIDIMRQITGINGINEETEHKLWDHLAMMARFQLDIDYPFEVTHALNILQKPEPLSNKQQRPQVAHYGKLLFEIFDKLKTMEPGEERDQLIMVAGRQMKRSLIEWSHGAHTNEKVADDLAHYTDGKIQLDPDCDWLDDIDDNGQYINKKGSKGSKGYSLEAHRAERSKGSKG